MTTFAFYTLPLIISSIFFLITAPKKHRGPCVTAVVSLLTIGLYLLEIYVQGHLKVEYYILFWSFNYLLVFFVLFFFCALSKAECVYTTAWIFSSSYILGEIQELVCQALHINWFASFPAVCVPVLAAGSIILYFFCKNFYWQKKLYSTSWKQAVVACMLYLSSNIISLSLLPKPGDYSYTVARICLLSINTSGIFLLYIQSATLATQRETQEKLLLEHMLQSKQQQFDILKDSIERINQNCHDMKHQILALRRSGLDSSQQAFLDETLKNIQTYESVLDTGNEALNVVLADKAITCRDQGIGLYCMIDGKSLGFMQPVDIYNIFGNALDNAIESVSQEPEVDKRSISVQASVRQNFCIIQIENYCPVRPEFEDEIPKTTKSDGAQHGYGVKSIIYSVEKYNGVVKIHADEQSFVLRILIPLSA